MYRSRRRGNNLALKQEITTQYWESYSDLMVSLLLILLLAVVGSIVELSHQKSAIKETQNFAEEALLKAKEEASKAEELARKAEEAAQKAEELARKAEEEGNTAEAEREKARIANEEAAAARASAEEAKKIADEREVHLKEAEKRLDDVLGIRTTIVNEILQAMKGTPLEKKVTIDAQTGDIGFEDRILFTVKSFDLLPEAKVTLNEFFRAYFSALEKHILKGYIAEIQIVGFTSEEGDFESVNLPLSADRAKSVARYLYSNRENLVPPSLGLDLLKKVITICGKGDAMHKATREESRRVEIKFRLHDDVYVNALKEALDN